MKKIIPFIIISVLLVLCLSLFAFAAGAPDVRVTATAGGESIEIAPAGSIFYLPSTVDTSKLTLKFSGELSYKNESGTYSGTITAGQTLDLTKAKAEDERGVPCYKLKLTAGSASADFIFYSDESLAAVYVTTSKGLTYIEQNKNNRDKGAKITIVNESGKVEYSDTSAGSTSEIKGRGNATFGYYKKPYQIKLSSKTALLGMDKSKTWILLANYTDQTALHNAMAFTMGDALGVPFGIEYRFVNLYIDGEYRGMYMICEKVQIDSSRVDIEDLEKATEKANDGVELDTLRKVRASGNYLTNSTIITEYQYIDGVKNPSDITGGYLVELDNNYGTSEPCYFKTKNGNVYVVKSPEYASRAQVEYIATLFAEMEEAIYSDTGYNRKGKHFSEYMDIESFAGVYTVQELMKNWDAYTSSMFFFKDADKGGATAKIYMGPLWDLDNTLGNIRFDDYYFTDTSYLWAQNGVFNKVVRTYAKNLMKHYEFQEAVAESYATVYKEVQGYLSAGGWLEENSEKIYSSVMMDRTRWEMYDSNRWLLNRYGSKSSVKFIQFAEYGEWDDTEQTTALGFMRYYLSSRAEALKSSIGTVTAEKPPVQNTTGTTAITGIAQGTTSPEGTTGENSTATATGSTTASEGKPSGGCGAGSANMESAMLGGGAIAIALGGIAGTKAGKKKKDGEDK
ncbi:MAG: CotH kinase family protein [Clostridia bacterium]|nr:CotH kinase family protein [Clostridia bacterium]